MHHSLHLSVDGVLSEMLPGFLLIPTYLNENITSQYVIVFQNTHSVNPNLVSIHHHAVYAFLFFK